MGTLYFSIFGMIIAFIDTIIYFTSLWQKDKLVILHGLYFLGFFICGMVAILGTDAHSSALSALPGTSILLWI